MTELALDDTEGMLDLCAYLGDDLMGLLVDRVELAALGCLSYGTPDFAIFAKGCLAFGADIALVGPDRCLLALEQLIPDQAFMYLCERGLETVNGAAFHTDTNMGLNAKNANHCPFFAEDISGSRDFVCFLVEDGASMIGINQRARA